MDRLKDNWLTEGLIDFEYKKYQLLAYFKEVKSSFNRVELYPFLSDLVFHYRNLVSLKENHSLLRDSFPKELSQDGLKNLELNYQRMIEDDCLMQEIESIIEYALPQFKTSLDEGSYIYELVESKCAIYHPLEELPFTPMKGIYSLVSPPRKKPTFIDIR